MSRRTTARILKIFSFTAAVAIFLLGLLSGTLSPSVFRILLVSAGCFLLVLVFCADRFYRSLVSDFSNDICETVDALMEDREPDNFQPYEDSAVSKAQGKLLQYYDKMRDEHRQSALERQTLQELVNDISHQVKTPVANIQMFTGILREHELDPEKRNEFLSLMSAQISKLDFLMQSLIKMSRWRPAPSLSIWKNPGCPTPSPGQSVPSGQRRNRRIFRSMWTAAAMSLSATTPNGLRKLWEISWIMR